MDEHRIEEILRILAYIGGFTFVAVTVIGLNVIWRLDTLVWLLDKMAK